MVVFNGQALFQDFQMWVQNEFPKQPCEVSDIISLLYYQEEEAWRDLWHLTAATQLVRARFELKSNYKSCPWPITQSSAFSVRDQVACWGVGVGGVIPEYSKEPSSKLLYMGVGWGGKHSTKLGCYPVREANRRKGTRLAGNHSHRGWENSTKWKTVEWKTWTHHRVQGSEPSSTSDKAAGRLYTSHLQSGLQNHSQVQGRPSCFHCDMGGGYSCFPWG